MYILWKTVHCQRHKLLKEINISTCGKLSIVIQNFGDKWLKFNAQKVFVTIFVTKNFGDNIFPIKLNLVVERETIITKILH